MKTKDMQVGVLYAYQPDKRQAPQPVVVVSTVFCFARRHPSRAFTKPDARFIEPAPDHLPKRCSVGQFVDTHWGYPAVTNRHPMTNRLTDYPAAAPRALLAVDEATVLDIPVADRNTAVPGHDGVYPLVVDPKHLTGPWEDAIEAWEDAQQMAADLRDQQARAAQDARDAAQARYDRVAALGVPGPFPDTRWGRTDEVTLTVDQFEALLSLIPDGTRYQEPWEYPEGRR